MPPVVIWRRMHAADVGGLALVEEQVRIRSVPVDYVLATEKAQREDGIPKVRRGSRVKSHPHAD